MSNLTTTDVDIGDAQIDEAEHEDGVINFGGADVLARWTILARHTGNGKWQIYAVGGSSNGNGVPQGILTHEVTATGSGDLPVRMMIKGVVNVNRLIVDAAGDASTITAAVRDLLRDHGITPVDVDQVGGALYTDEDS